MAMRVPVFMKEIGTAPATYLEEEKGERALSGVPLQGWRQHGAKGPQDPRKAAAALLLLGV